MSADLESTDDVMMCCACCGKAAVDDVKLKKCSCNLVRYCSVECQKKHRTLHKKACKKRLAELLDDRLFRQPDVIHHGECPICCLALPLDEEKSFMNSCCCKYICDGCCHANKQREAEQRQENKCPYCREPLPTSQEEMDQNLMKRVKANDPVAMFKMGVKCEEEGDYEGAIQYWTKAATLGDMMAHFNLSIMYQLGKCVEEDNKKRVYHLEEAAIGGHPMARYNLGCVEWESERYNRAMQHFIIAAKLGLDEALEHVKKCFQGGVVSKEDYASTLRGHQAAIDATKSKQREASYAFDKKKQAFLCTR
jgi:tetratricopeptide (TPR) repeat protein